MTYGIIANCNFESRDDATGQAVHAARRAAEANRVDDTALLSALDQLESTLADFAEISSPEAERKCTAAEQAVEVAWTAIADAE